MKNRSDSEWIEAFLPITSRVRTDITAVKMEDGSSRWRKKQSLSNERLIKHIEGSGPRGVCPINESESTTKLALLDLDSHKGKSSWKEMTEVANLVCKELIDREMHPIPFRSSGGKGIHIYLIWNNSQDAFSVRDFLSTCLNKINFKNGTNGVSNKEIEIFPKQNTVDKGRCGNQFILPLAGKSRPLDFNNNMELKDKYFFFEIDWKTSKDIPQVKQNMKETNQRVINEDPLSYKIIEDKIEELIDFIDPTSRESWIRVGMIIHYETKGSEDGKILWDQWSSKASSYKDYDDINKTWKSFKHDRTNPLTIATLAKMAIDQGYTTPIECDPHEPDKINPQIAANKYEVISVRDFCNQPPPSWIIKNFLPEKAIGMIFGPSGSGKSFVALDMAMSVALGKHWNGNKVKQGHVVYIAAEGADGFRKRIKAYEKKYDINLDNIDFGIVPATPDLHKENVKELIKSLARDYSPSLVIIDTLAQVSSSADENSQEMSKVINNCKSISEQLEASVLLVHHTGKDQTKGARGWSGIKAAMDTEIQVVAKNDFKYLEVTKQKDGESGQKLGFELIPQVIGLDEDFEKVTSCTTKFLDKEQFVSSYKPITKNRLKGPYQNKIIETLEEHISTKNAPIKTSELINIVVKGIPYDEGSESEKPKRDRRRENVKRSIDKMCEDELLILNDNFITLPASHILPHVEDNLDAESNHYTPHNPHDSIGVRECGMAGKRKTAIDYA